MQWQRLPLQHPPLYSYLKVGRLLHWSLLLFIVESVWYGIELKQAMMVGSVFVIVLSFRSRNYGCRQESRGT